MSNNDTQSKICSTTLKFVEEIQELKESEELNFETRTTYCPDCGRDTAHQMIFDLITNSGHEFPVATESQCLSCKRRVDLGNKKEMPK